MIIVQADVSNASDLDAVSALAAALWPEQSAAEHRAQIAQVLAEREAVCFLARADTGELAGFAQATVRRDWVNGCETCPVAFLEGLYVDAEHRRAGVAAALVEAVEAWARAKGSTELGSDTLVENTQSQAFHAAFGFEERERVVCFRKVL